METAAIGIHGSERRFAGSVLFGDGLCKQHELFRDGIGTQRVGEAVAEVMVVCELDLGYPFTDLKASFAN